MTVLATPAANRLLGAFSSTALETYLPHLELVDLEKGDVLADAGIPSEFGYFPVDSVVSSLFLSRNGSCTGTSMVGSEGMLGVKLLLGGDTMPERSEVLYGGRAYRLPARQLCLQGVNDRDTLGVLLEYVQTLIVQISLTAACARHHSLGQRLSRFLLMSLDRLPSGTVPVTQEAIAQILGVRREGVTEAINRLQQDGIVNCRRGHIQVLDHVRLAECCCECYGVVRMDYAQLPPALPHELSPQFRRMRTNQPLKAA